MQPAFISFINSITASSLAIFGVVLGCAGAVGLFKGLYDEEQSEDYVHKRKYWYGIIAMMYVGIVLACHGSGGWSCICQNPDFQVTLKNVICPQTNFKLIRKQEN